MPWRSRWSGLTLSRTATSGANATESSSWNEEHSQTIVASGSSVVAERGERRADVAGDPGGHPGLAKTWPSHSVTVVLPFVPVTATKRFGSQPPAELELADHGLPRARAAAITGAS